MDKAIISFSFDDGRLDNYTVAYPILKKYNLPATFNITTGYIKGSIDRNKFEFPEPMTSEMIREMYRDSQCEIAGHGNQHINTLEDIVSGIKELQMMLNTETLCKRANGFASPGSDLTNAMYNEMKSQFDSYRIRYVRISCRYNSFTRLKVLLRKLSRIIRWPWLYKMAYKDTLMAESLDGIVYSVPVLSSVTVGQIRGLIGQAVKEKKACVLMFHSIVDYELVRNNWDYSAEKFEKICLMLKNLQKDGRLKVKTVMDMYMSLSQN